MKVNHEFIYLYQPPINSLIILQSALYPNCSSVQKHSPPGGGYVAVSGKDRHGGNPFNHILLLPNKPRHRQRILYLSYTTVFKSLRCALFVDDIFFSVRTFPDRVVPVFFKTVVQAQG
eukprot:gb/GEZJ01001484.1/.p1 GENE.gb/GEZJ01001484.1/~~gb/GEZJ01001484.1/.p1  ORF type:complete len:118 (-),score=8.73 gb/GEZJ01001484.1/:849-1202(-)